jgi:hypothetical protein
MLVMEGWRILGLNVWPSGVTGMKGAKGDHIGCPMRLEGLSMSKLLSSFILSAKPVLSANSGGFVMNRPFFSFSE